MVHMSVCLPLRTGTSLGLGTVPPGTGSWGIEASDGGSVIDGSRGGGHHTLIEHGGGGSGGSSSGGGSSSSLLGLGGLLLLVLLELLNIAVEEEVNRNVPLGGARDSAAKAEDLTGEKPEEEADRELTLVVGRDSDVNVLEGGVGVAESDDGYVRERGLANGLGISAGVSDDKQTGLAELLGDLVGEGSGGEATSERLSAGVMGEL